MSIHLHRDMEGLNREILDLSRIVQEVIDKASWALSQRRLDLAEEVLQADDEINRREVRVEEECLKILALHQPLAADLRCITTVIKINSDLERIGDLAANIAERAKFLAGESDFPIPAKLARMVDRATNMVRMALDSFVHLDAEAARHVCGLDDEVDQYNRKIIDDIHDLMRRQPELIAPAMHCFSASRHVERIADHATNIAEYVIYLIEGKIVRHKHDEMQLPN